MDVKLTLEEKEILKQFEDGRLLQEITNTPGWQRILDIMEAEVAQAEFQLMNYDGCDKEALVAIHRRARTKREFFQEIQRKIAVKIEAAVRTPSLINQRFSPVEEAF